MGEILEIRSQVKKMVEEIKGLLYPDREVKRLLNFTR